MSGKNPHDLPPHYIIRENQRTEKVDPSTIATLFKKRGESANVVEEFLTYYTEDMTAPERDTFVQAFREVYDAS